MVVGAEAHATLLKSVAMLGLGRNRVTTVPTDHQGRLRADALPKLVGPTIVCLQAGNVNTGAFDPAREVCQRAHEVGAWVHVDGAFGLWAAAAPARAHLIDGIGNADSWATDFSVFPLFPASGPGWLSACFSKRRNNERGSSPFLFNGITCPCL